MVTKKTKPTEEQVRTTSTAYFLMFPCFVLAAMATLWAPGIPSGGLAIALSIYQFFMLKKFIEDYYKK